MMPKYTYTVTLIRKVWIHSTKLVDFSDCNFDAIGHVRKIIFILPLLLFLFLSHCYTLFFVAQAEFDPSSSSDSDSDSGGLLHPSGSSHALSNGQVGAKFCCGREQCCGSMTFWCGSMPLTNGSGSWIQILLFSLLTFKMPTKST
jgi:hypothetical protein